MTLPASIGSLVNLEELDLSQNSLVTIPDLSQLTKLKKLNLGYNKINELPDFFASLISLEELSLANNGIVTLPPSFGKLKALKSLDLKGNQLITLPAVLFECTNLWELSLYKNGTTQLPNEFAKLKELKILDLTENQLKDIPTSFSNLEKLEDLSLSYNPFDQILPKAVYAFVSLKKLTYLNFKLSIEKDFKPQSLSNQMCVLQNLEELEINATELISLPACFGNLNKLKQLSLTLSPKSYLLPNEIAQLTNLERLKYVSRGYPIRELPANMRNLSKLKRLELGKTQLSEAQKLKLTNDLPNCRIKIQ